MFIEFIRVRELRLSLILFITIILFYCPVIAQTTRLVPATYATIAAAISAAANGDTIDITGTITEPQIDLTKSLMIRGHGTLNTIVKNATGTTAVFNVTAGTSTFKNMTIRDGRYGINLLNTNLNISGCDIIYNNLNGIYSFSSLYKYTVNIQNSNICYNGGGFANGGGIYNGSPGKLIISTSNISHNALSGGSWIQGGGIYNFGNCTVTNCIISDNRLSGSTICEGGGIYNSINAKITISNCLISNNTLTGSDYNLGGAVYNYGECTIINDTIRNNTLSVSTYCQGGGIYNYNTCTINNSTIRYNTLSGKDYNLGGGIYNSNNAKTTISNCHLANNTLSASIYCEGGGFYNYGTTSIINCFIHDNTLNGSEYNLGGGIYNFDTCTINDCTISNNSLNASDHNYGGGIYNTKDAQIKIYNSTVCNNLLNAGKFLRGGGIFNILGYCAINNCTIASNKITASSALSLLGGGIFNDSSTGTTTIIKNSILANNMVQGVLNEDYHGNLISYGYNLVGQNPAPVFISTDLIGVNPGLDILRDNGGPTMTMALLNGSPAINAADKTDIYGNQVLFDQRNSKRYNINDIGAYEKNNTVVQITKNICSNFNDQVIIQIELFAEDTATIHSFTFNTAGTTFPPEILNARLYFTGTSSTFSTGFPFGQVYNIPNGSFTITDTIKFHGSNFFWLTYNISNSAQVGHNFDASVNQIQFDTFTYIPEITSPPGFRTIPLLNAGFQINNQAQCLAGNNFIFTDNSLTSSGVLSYHWSFGDSTVSSSASPTHFYLHSDTFKVNLVVYNADGCSDSVSNIAVIFPNPVARFSVNDTAQCFYTNLFVFTDSSRVVTGKIDSLFWDFGDGNSATGKLNSHSYFNSGNYVVQLVAQSNNDCFDTIKKTVRLIANAQAAFTINDSSQCLKDNLFQFTDQSTGFPKYRTDWFFGDGFHDSLKSLSHHYNNKGRFDVKLVVSSNIICFDTLIKSVTVKSSPLAGFTINDSAQCMVGNSFIFNNTSDVWSVLFDWSFGDGHYALTTNPIHAYFAAGQFPVKLKATSVDLCTDSMIKWVKVKPNPSTPMVSSNSPVCLGNDILLKAKSSNNVNYEWTTDFGFKSNLQNPRIYRAGFADSGEYKVKATLDGCESEIVGIYVKILPIPYVYLGNDSVFCFKHHILLDPGEFSEYLWQDNSTSRTYEVTKSGTYIVMVTGENQCKNSDTIHFIIRCPASVFIPTTFSPSGDGINETFRIEISNISEFYLLIYDRWGEKIFTGNDPNVPWDGKYMGEICQAGYYYYSLTYKADFGGIKVVNGQVLLMR